MDKLQKRCFLLFFYFLCAGQIFAQANIFPSSGNVGIGTTNPLSSISNSGLHISGGIHSTLLLGDPIGQGYGGVIQTSDGKHRVFIGANIFDDGINSWGAFASGKGSAGISLVADEDIWGTQITFVTSTSDGHYNRSMVINGSGKIGIGITNPSEKLTVNGTVKAEEVIVEENVGADFVFEDDYPLPSLSEVESYIQLNKHLPDIPSAEEMIKNGIKVGELQMKLLQKIEELMLYVIEQQKFIKAKKEIEQLLETEISIQNKYLENLEERIAKLEKRNIK